MGFVQPGGEQHRRGIQLLSSTTWMGLKTRWSQTLLRGAAWKDKGQQARVAAREILI